jgi:ferredoxin
VSNEHSGNDSLAQHEEEMKVGKVDRYLFGEMGSTPVPVPQPPKPVVAQAVAQAEAAGHTASAPEATEPSDMPEFHAPAPYFGALEDPKKVGKLERFLFGEHGATPIPTVRPEPEQHDLGTEVSAKSQMYFSGTADASTDAEYQKILLERVAQPEPQEIVVPEGYAPVTFIEADITLIAPIGANLRNLCLDNNIPLYTELTKLLHCRGLGLCTTCRVAVDPASGVTPPTAMEKVHLIRDNPKYRLSCQCEVTGPVKVSTKPAREYGKVFENFVRNASLLGAFTLIMLSILLVIGFDVVGKWF